MSVCVWYLIQEEQLRAVVKVAILTRTKKKKKWKCIIILKFLL